VLVVELTEDRRGALGLYTKQLGGFIAADDVIDVKVGADELPVLLDRLRALVADATAELLGGIVGEQERPAALAGFRLRAISAV
jgi:hypothetical protein